MSMSALRKRVRRIVSAAIESGPRSVLLTRGAKQRGAAQKVREFSALVALLRKRKLSVVVEIGTLHGGTLWAWCQLAEPNALIVSIDLPGGEFGGGYNPDAGALLRSYAHAQQELVLIRDDSHAPRTFEELENLLAGRRVDFLFIDGDHTYEGVKRDFDMYSQLVATDGIVALHDIVHHPGDPDCEVDVFWQEVSTTWRTIELVDLSDVRSRGQWGGIGVVRC
jgi:predicted O-methyltransferase YrrM